MGALPLWDRDSMGAGTAGGDSVAPYVSIHAGPSCTTENLLNKEKIPFTLDTTT